MCIDKLHGTINKYNNAYHRNLLMQMQKLWITKQRYLIQILISSKISADKKDSEKMFEAKLVYNKKFLKTKKNYYGDELALL